MNQDLKTTGAHPFARNEKGELKSRIATLFVDANELITVRGTHYTQRELYVAALNEKRAAAGLAPLATVDEKLDAWKYAVDLIITGNCIQIRPETSRMELALQADEMLQQIVSKRAIRFLHASDANVQQAVRELGEYWRICPFPHLAAEEIVTIENSRIAIKGNSIYYYSAETGTRYLTCQEFNNLAKLNDDALRLHLLEIQEYSQKKNIHNFVEVALFEVTGSFGKDSFKGLNFTDADPAQLRRWHQDLSRRFAADVPPTLQIDDPRDKVWRAQMIAALMNEKDGTLTGSVVSDLTPEFFRMIRWLPGGRIVNGSLAFDSIFKDCVRYRADQELAELCDQKVKGFIANYIYEFGNIEYVNIGWVLPSIRIDEDRHNGHRVYIAEVKHLGDPKPVLRILRMQQWGMREHLDDTKIIRDKLFAFEKAMEYTEFTRDRRLACWELGMPLPGRIDTKFISEIYRGNQERYHGHRIWTTYYERDFIKGQATNKIPKERLQDPEYALLVAALLGQAAAPNIVVGRTKGEYSNRVVFDSGDEMILSDSSDKPARIVVADHAGTFYDYTSDLKLFAKDYAAPVIKRRDMLTDTDAFAEVYLEALAERLNQMQEECRRMREVFKDVFQNSKQGPETFADRWDKVLDRLEKTDIAVLISSIRDAIEKSEAL